MTRKIESITLSISPEEKEALAQIAQDLGENWGDGSNISKLIRAIANGKYALVLAPTQQEAYLERIKEAVEEVEASLRKVKRFLK